MSICICKTQRDERERKYQQCYGNRLAELLICIHYQKQRGAYIQNRQQKKKKTSTSHASNIHTSYKRLDDADNKFQSS